VCLAIVTPKQMLCVKVSLTSTSIKLTMHKLIVCMLYCNPSAALNINYINLLLFQKKVFAFLLSSCGYCLYT